MDLQCAECELPLGSCARLGCPRCAAPEREEAADAAEEADREREDEEDDEEEEDENVADLNNQFSKLMSDSLFMEFERHEADVRNAHARRREALRFQTTVEDLEKTLSATSIGMVKDMSEGLGTRLPGDEYQGDVNYRTLQALLTRIDQRGFERCVRARAPTSPRTVRTPAARSLLQVGAPA